MVCPGCERRRAWPGFWLGHLCWLRTLHQGGYRFERGELPESAWHDLGVLNDLIDSMRMVF